MSGQTAIAFRAMVDESDPEESVNVIRNERRRSLAKGTGTTAAQEAPRGVA